MASNKRYQTDKNAAMVSTHLAKFSRGLTRSEIISTLGVDGISESTIWRWLNSAKEYGLVEMQGSTSNARWFASEEMRRIHTKEYIERPLTKRPMMTYNELWLKDYVPNETSYLCARDLGMLNKRAPRGSAPLSKFDKHDMSSFLCGIPYGSSALEGNSYELVDTVRLIEQGMAKKSATFTETKMILNHHDAVRYLIENIHTPPTKSDISLRVSEIKAIHSLLSYEMPNIRPEECGRIRNESIAIQMSSYKPLTYQEELESCLATILNIASKIQDPYEQSFFLLVHISYLQPFIDCNKRTARMTCNIPLLRSGIPPMSWIGVSMQSMRDALLGVYELNDTSMMSELFVDGYMRSVEDFNIMRQSREPDEVGIKYHREIRQSIREKVMNGIELIPENVAPEDQFVFLEHVDRELQSLKSGDEGAMIRNRLREGDVQIWIAAESADLSTERQRE
jgi:Fic family protein